MSHTGKSFQFIMHIYQQLTHCHYLEGTHDDEWLYFMISNYLFLL